MSTAGADDPPPSFESVQDDPYLILGVEATATDDEIKSAYKKLCLKWHPDKNQGDSDAEVMFQKVQSAWGILSSPELRAKYDAGGMDALEGSALNENGIQVDISQTGFMGSTLLAMFRKLGHPIKTVVSPSVLDAVKSPSALQTSPLQWGEEATGRVGNGQALFYVLDISPEHLDHGFVVVASCVHARVKLLLWDLDDEGGWSLAAQEDAVKVGQANATALYATTAELLEGVPRSVQAHVQAAAMVDRTQQDPFAHIFRVLDAAKVKDRLTLKPGQHLLAVYGDNFFKKSQFTLTATLLTEGTARDEVAATEREIIDKRAELLAFEREFKRSRQEFESAVSKLETYTQALDALFLKREVEYASLLSLPAPAAAAASTSGALPEDGEPPLADDSTSGPGSPSAGDAAARSGQLSGSLSGGLASAGNSSSSFVTEQAKHIRNAASQASTQISGAFRGLFSKTGQRKTDPGWSTADTPPAPAADAVPVTADTPDAAAPTATSRTRSFFRAFSRTSQTGAASPEPLQTDVATAGPEGAAEAPVQAVPAQPLPGVVEVAAETPTAAAAGPAGADVPQAGSTDASASLSGALFVSGVPHADDSTPTTPGAAAADESAMATAPAHVGTFVGGEPVVEESESGEALPGGAADADAEPPQPFGDALEGGALAPAAASEPDAPAADPAEVPLAPTDTPDAAVASQGPQGGTEASAGEEEEAAPAVVEGAEEAEEGAADAGFAASGAVDGEEGAMDAADDAAPAPVSPAADSGAAALSPPAEELPGPTASVADAVPAAGSPTAVLKPAAFSPTPDPEPTTFSPKADFEPATFSPKADLEPAPFSPKADVQPAAFSPKADLEPVTFSPKADLEPAPFSPTADLEPATFSPTADLEPVTFSPKADLEPATFSPKAGLEPATLSPTAEDAAPAAASPAAAESAEDSFTDAPEAEESVASQTPEPPAEESSQSSFVRRMQERFSKGTP